MGRYIEVYIQFSLQPISVMHKTVCLHTVAIIMFKGCITRHFASSLQMCNNIHVFHHVCMHTGMDTGTPLKWCGYVILIAIFQVNLPGLVSGTFSAAQDNSSVKITCLHITVTCYSYNHLVIYYYFICISVSFVAWMYEDGDVSMVNPERGYGQGYNWF